MGESSAPRVFISYAPDSTEHEESVRNLWIFLRCHGIDARIDLPGAEGRQDWPTWTRDRLRDADFVIVVASDAYKRRAEDTAETGDGDDVRSAAHHIRDAFHRNDPSAPLKYVPVLLPGHSAGEIPEFLAAASAPYEVTDFTVRGTEKLMRTLMAPPPRSAPSMSEPLASPAPPAASRPGARSPLSHELVLAVAVQDGRVSCEATLAGAVLGRHGASLLPVGSGTLARAMDAPPRVAEERLIEAGRALCAALLTEDTTRHIARLLHDSRFGTVVDVVIDVEGADGAASALPYELLRLPDGRLLATVPGVHVRRRIATTANRTPTASPGPLKILVAVAPPTGNGSPAREPGTRGVPDATTGPWAALDPGTDRRATLDAVADLRAMGAAEVRVLEDTDPRAIAEALRTDRYHVLHLSAPSTSPEEQLPAEHLTAAPADAEAGDVIRPLQDGLIGPGDLPPLVVISGCAAAVPPGPGGDAPAVTLIRRGADRVLAMQAPVTARYATLLTTRFYTALATGAALTPAAALADARNHLEQERMHLTRADPDNPPPPEYAIATLLSTGDDLPLIAPATPPVPLSRS
ncbi:CHAT domain-containing protein [Sphaerisporangium sp. NPDC051017]|uniref:CHAT domain-containing protein n=1 Tax=Sphaerisporangium sp. NPDC051017 TaxID=3154636 RepID=UPI003448A8EC